VVRGHYQAHIEGHGLATAHARHLPFLQHSQQLGLQTQVEVGNSVQKQRAAVGFFHSAHVPGHRSGKRALFVPEQLAFHQFTRNGGHVHGHERLVRPARLKVNGLGHQLLPGTGFAAHAHGDGGARRFGDERVHELHRRVLAENGLSRTVAVAYLLTQLRVFVAQQRLLLHLAHRVPEAVQGVGVFYKVVVCSLAQHAHGCAHVFLA